MQNRCQVDIIYQKADAGIKQLLNGRFEFATGWSREERINNFE